MLSFNMVEHWRFQYFFGGIISIFKDIFVIILNNFSYRPILTVVVCFLLFGESSAV